ncbi:MAG TPA: hypothetical protein DDY78_05735 [Planctomycetales bacterium]|nr:hypothetical protein [Planctomycetales bacterium]
MAERLCCSNGHRWTPVFAPDKWPPDFRSSCPVCGAAPISPGDATATTVRVTTFITVMFAVAGLALLLLSANTIPFAIINLIIAAILLMVGVGVWVGRQRTKEMAAVAEAMNFTFMAHLLLGWLRAIGPFKLFALGRDQKAYNALFGRVGECEVIFFEYQYTTGSGKSSQTHRLGVVILPDGAPGRPNFQLTPRTFFDKFAGLFTTKGMELEDAGEFNRRCKLVGRDEDALRKTFNPDLVEYLGRDGRWHIEVLNGQLLLHRQTRLKPDKCPGMVTDALEVRDLLRGPQQSNL